jgi:very-short-patch-repair endonuclease
MRFDRPRLFPKSTARARSLRRRMTWAEEKLWKALRGLDVNFRRQAAIGPYFADFATHGVRLIIEVDGEVHERLDDVALRDHERQRWLESEGYTVLRFSNRQVEADLSACLEAVENQLALLLDGGGLGGGVAAVMKVTRLQAPAPNCAEGVSTLLTPPSPTLPPSRRKGE